PQGKPGSAASASSDSWAVVIGGNDYQHPRVPKLHYAVNAARAVERAVFAQGAFVATASSRWWTPRPPGRRWNASSGTGCRVRWAPTIASSSSSPGIRCRRGTVRSGDDLSYLLGAPPYKGNHTSRIYNPAGARHR